MASPASLGSRALRASRRQLSAPILQKRGLAAPASGSFGYETGEANGVKFASRDLPNPTTTLTVVAKAGTRYQPLPGLTDALEKFAFLVRYRKYKPEEIKTNTIYSRPRNDQPYESLEKSSFSVERRLHPIPARISSSQPSSSEMICLISPSCWGRSFRKRVIQVGVFCPVVEKGSNGIQPMNSTKTCSVS